MAAAQATATTRAELLLQASTVLVAALEQALLGVMPPLLLVETAEQELPTRCKQVLLRTTVAAVVVPVLFLMELAVQAVGPRPMGRRVTQELLTLAEAGPVAGEAALAATAVQASSLSESFRMFSSLTR